MLVVLNQGKWFRKYVNILENMWKYAIFQYDECFIAQVLICDMLQTCFGLTGHTENYLCWKQVPYNLEKKSWCCCQ